MSTVNFFIILFQASLDLKCIESVYSTKALVRTGIRTQMNAGKKIIFL